MGFIDFIRDRWLVLSLLAYQHMSLVVQTLVLATVLASSSAFSSIAHRSE